MIDYEGLRSEDNIPRLIAPVNPTVGHGEGNPTSLDGQLLASVVQSYRRTELSSQNYISSVVRRIRHILRIFAGMFSNVNYRNAHTGSRALFIIDDAA